MMPRVRAYAVAHMSPRGVEQYSALRGAFAFKKMAYKLHGKKCEMMRGLQPMNAEGPGVVRFKENASVSAQKILTKARAEELSLYS